MQAQKKTRRSYLFFLRGVSVMTVKKYRTWAFYYIRHFATREDYKELLEEIYKEDDKARKFENKKELFEFLKSQESTWEKDGEKNKIKK
jgi:hypothetical protein